MNRKRLITWTAAAVTSLIVAIALPLLTLMPGVAQTAPPTPQYTTTVTSGSATANLKVYAAVSLLEVLTDLEKAYNNNGSTTPKINFTNSLDSSGILLQNINYAPNETAGIPDVFISAATSQMTSLQSAGKLATGWPQNVAKNKLVLIKPNTPTSPAPTPSNAISAFNTLLNGSGRSGIRGIAIGDPSIVPAGAYAQQVLTSTGTGCGGGTYTTLLNNSAPNKLFFATNVRNVLSAVETKTLNSNVIDAGIVYSTDKQVSTLTTLVATSPSTCLTTPIVYPEAVLTRSTSSTAANSFANFIRTNSAAQTALTNRGFLLP